MPSRALPGSPAARRPGPGCCPSPGAPSSTTSARPAFRPRTAASVDWTEAADQHRAATHGEAAGFEDLVEVNLLLDTLESERREALVLTQILGLSYAEAADICRCPLGTIRSRVARARDDLLNADQTRREGMG